MEQRGWWTVNSHQAVEPKLTTFLDLIPTPPEKRTWLWYNYVLFFFALSFGNWTLGSSLIGIGLNWWQSILAIFISQLISSIAMFFNSRCASVYHIGFPVVARSVFGMWGSFYYVGARGILAIVWYGVQLYSGSGLVANLLRAIFGKHYTEGIPNKIPAAQGITSAGMVAFFLFFLAHFPLALFRPYQLRKFFLFKTIVMIPAVFGLFVFCMVNTKGQLGTGHLQAAAAGTTSTNGWGCSLTYFYVLLLMSFLLGSRPGRYFVYAINTGMGNTATLITNQPDIARWTGFSWGIGETDLLLAPYLQLNRHLDAVLSNHGGFLSRTKTGSMYSQLITNPIAVTLSASLGILATAAINNAWGLELWNQWDLLDAIMDRYWSGTTRFAVSLVSICWAISLLGTNVAANMIPFCADISMVFPRYFNLVRGSFFVAVLGYAVVPWKILASASIFTTFLAGYGLFMASVSAIMICDYYMCCKGNVFVVHLFSGHKTNPHYYYHKGWNIQALIAYLVGIALCLPGFAAELGAKGVSKSGLNLGHLGWMLSFTVSFVVYYAICKVWPTHNQRIIKEMGLGWEEMAARDQDILDGVAVPENSSEDGQMTNAWDEDAGGKEKDVTYGSRPISR